MPEDSSVENISPNVSNSILSDTQETPLQQQEIQKYYAGRPTKFSPDHSNKALEYLRKSADLDRIPTLAGLAFSFGVGKATIQDWCKRDNTFSSVIDCFNASQEDILINDKNTMRMIFLLKNSHGYKDKQETEVYGKDGAPVISFITETKELPSP